MSKHKEVMDAQSQEDNMSIFVKQHNGGPAFGHGNPQDGGDPGMSLRDWFAGQALAGEVQFDATRSPANIARDAYATADAMLSTREEHTSDQT